MISKFFTTGGSDLFIITKNLILNLQKYEKNGKIHRFALNLKELSNVPSSPICLVRWGTRYSTTPPSIQRIELGFTLFFPEVPAMRGWLYQQEVVIRFFYPKLPTL